MIALDGSAGGGQLLRSALTFSALTGEAFEMTEIRGNRPNPGLRPQHRASVALVADICDADVSTLDIGADSLKFEPGSIRPGTYETDIGTAGSITLLFDTVLPLATAIDAPLVVRARGGTDVKWSPTMDYYRQVKLPVLRQYGLQATVETDRRGFYPAGGGSARLRIAPSSLSALNLMEWESVRESRVYSVASADLAEQSVAERQAARAVERLDDEEFAPVEWTVQYAETRSAGSALVVSLASGGSRAGFDTLGEPGTPAEAVADEAVESALAFAAEGGAVDTHAADQFLVFLALAGGAVAIPSVTPHVQTNRALLAEFGVDVVLDDRGDDHVLRV